MGDKFQISHLYTPSYFPQPSIPVDVFTEGQEVVQLATESIGKVGSINDLAIQSSAPDIIPLYESPRISPTVDYTLPSLPSFDGIVQPIMPQVGNIIAYASDFLTDIKNWITETITGDDIGLTSPTQDNIINLEVERELQKLIEEKYKESHKWADGNWTLPDGVLLANKSIIELKYNEVKYKKSIEIRKESIKVAIDRIRIAIQNSVKIEQALQGYIISLNKISAQIFGAQTEIFTSEIKAIASQIDALTKQYITRLSSYEAAYKVDEGNSNIAKLANSVSNSNVESSLSVMQQANFNSIEAFSKTVSNKIKAMDTATSACSALVSGYFSSVQASRIFGDSYDNTISSNSSWAVHHTSSDSDSKEVIVEE